jgi:hypothetical protein
MLRPTSDFKDMNEFIEQFRKKPAVSSQQSAFSRAEAFSSQQSAISQQEADSSQGESHGQPGQAEQTQHPQQAQQNGTRRVISQEEIQKNPDAYVIQKGPYPHVTDDYVLAEDGSLVHPRQMEWQVEARIKKQLGLPNNLYDEAAIVAWHKRQLALLEKADAAPRCEHVFIDGTTCQSPRMRKHQYCYAHARMLEVRPKKLKLLPAEDENSIMWNIMEIQRALIDDEISEKKAGLLLYGQQLALIAVRGTTFKMTDPDQMVRVMPRSGNREIKTSGNRKREESLPRMNAEKAGSEQNHTTDDTDKTDQNTQTKSHEPQRAQRGTKNRVIGRSCDRVIENPENTRTVPGDELDKSLFSGDEGRGAGGVAGEAGQSPESHGIAS